MILQMIGIDYEKADLDTRALFSFQNHAAQEAMMFLKENYDLEGCIILSTCNRTEIYISAKNAVDKLFDGVCEMKGVSSEDYKEYFVSRQNREAVHHLFQLACGIKSKVFGEDQIITQVKLALSLAREVDMTDSNLEGVFQSAIAAAKKVKSQVHLTAVKTSVIENMKQVLYKENLQLENCRCLVIGNGEIGRLAASAMVSECSNVTVTVRNYKTRQVEIPKGCKVIDYSDRLQHIKDFDIIVSATTSPHHTVKFEECADLLRDGKHRYLIDLAVPRDISSAFAREDGVTLYDIDSLGGSSKSEQDNKALEVALEIIKEHEEKLFEKKEVENYFSIIQSIGELSGEVAYRRVKKKIKKQVGDEEGKQVEELIRQGTEKTISSLLFDIKKQLSSECWESCIKAMKNTIEEQIF